jgi:hypothetical protein
MHGCLPRACAGPLQLWNSRIQGITLCDLSNMANTPRQRLGCTYGPQYQAALALTGPFRARQCGPNMDGVRICDLAAMTEYPEPVFFDEHKNENLQRFS